MSDLSATNCGCGCESSSGFEAIPACGLSFCSAAVAAAEETEEAVLAADDCLWIILLLCCCGGFGNGFNDNGCC